MVVGPGRLYDPIMPEHPRVVRAALIQAAAPCLETPSASPDDLRALKARSIEKHLKLIEQAAAKGAQICCLQELFFSPYFCAEQETRWYDLAEPIPDGPTVRLMMEQARRHRMVLVVPIYELDTAAASGAWSGGGAGGIFYNAAAVIDEQGRYLGKYRKKHLPHCHPGFWEKFYFKPGNAGTLAPSVPQASPPSPEHPADGGGYPVFPTRYGRIGVYICYDRHFPEGARELGLAGAEIVFNPSATVAGLSEYLWKLEQPAHAVANQYFVGAINRVGFEKPWNIGEFYGSSYFCNPRGQIIAQASRDRDEVLVADLNLDEIRQVREVWQFYRDRRPETYQTIARS